jgi:hypothetical protein
MVVNDNYYTGKTMKSIHVITRKLRLNMVWLDNELNACVIICFMVGAHTKSTNSKTL